MGGKDRLGKCSTNSENTDTEHLNPFGLSDHDYAIHLDANYRLRETRPETGEEAEVIEALVRLPPLGFQLDISPSLLDETERYTQSKRKRIDRRAKKTSCGASSSTVLAAAINDSEKSKPNASTFSAPISMLRIGSWQLGAPNEGDMVGKCDYTQKKLAWEILRENGLKGKIEIKWSDIIGIRATMKDNMPGILEVELQNPPKFYKEIESQRQKRTQWTDGSDFTQKRASMNRRHYVVFPPGVLDEYYQRLMKNDKRLFELSQGPFPTSDSIYFPP